MARPAAAPAQRCAETDSAPNPQAGPHAPDLDVALRKHHTGRCASPAAGRSQTLTSYRYDECAENHRASRCPQIERPCRDPNRGAGIPAYASVCWLHRCSNRHQAAADVEAESRRTRFLRRLLAEYLPERLTRSASTAGWIVARRFGDLAPRPATIDKNNGSPCLTGGVQRSDPRDRNGRRAGG